MIDRKIKPSPYGEIKFSLPEIKEFTHKNGLKILFVKKNNLPLVQFLLLCNAGSIFDPAGKKGLSNLTAMMLDEGAGEYDALQLSDEIDMLGSQINVRSDEDNFIISLQTLEENLERSFELLSKIITQPHFDDEDFQREKRKVLTAILQRKDNPDDVAEQIFEYNLYGKENPYSNLNPGNEKDINSITTEDIRNFYNKFLTAGNSALIVVGDIAEQKINELINNYLANWRKPAPELSKIPEPRRKGSTIVFCNKENAMQSEIRVGHLASKRNEGNYFAKLILNMILGGQFSSRINLNLRERKGLTYGAFSRFNYYRNQAHFYVSTSVSTENTGNAIREILSELKRIREGVTDEELEFAKSSLIRKFPLNFETYSQVAGNLTGKVIFSLPDDYFNTYIDKVRNVSKNDVNEAAKKEILAEETLIAVVGDKSKVREQLKEFKNSVFVEVDSEGEGLVS
jgi:zinc protease